MKEIPHLQPIKEMPKFKVGDKPAVIKAFLEIEPEDDFRPVKNDVSDKNVAESETANEDVNP